MVLKRQKNNQKKSFLKNMKFLLDKGEEVLNSFKSNIFPLKNQTLESTPDSKVIFIHLHEQNHKIRYLKIKYLHLIT